MGVCAGDLDEEGHATWRFAVGYRIINDLRPPYALVGMHGLERNNFGLEDMINYKVVS